ncbi:MAG: hypothetical protein ACI82Z_001590 [Cellvibrionaceae bacterium]|jgi:hypothetical protein
MVSKAKLYPKLDELETQLREILLPHLRNAAEGKNNLIFCVKVFNPFSELKHKTDKLTEELIEMGSQILSLREKLGESSSGTIAERVCWYCREWGNTEKNYRSSGASLAKQFLAEIENE